MIDQLTLFLGTEITYALGWTIIHSLWQVSLLALIMSGLHKVYQHKPSEFKYNVSLCSILLSLAFSVVTFTIYYLDVSSTTVAETIVSTTFRNTTINSSSISILESINNVFTNNLHHISTIWVVGIMLFSLKFAVSFGYIKYIKSTATEILDPTIQKLLANTKISIGIKKTVLFVESTKINVPMVLGHVKPIILFPIGMINMLAIEEIEAIVAHELFHIKRNDFVVNMALTVIEIVYFFHPAMWWISANIKAERENCCDDAAINYNIDSVTYAKVLVKLEEMRHAGIPSLAMPFASNKHQLLNRIKRILNMEQTKNDIREKSVATVLLLFVAMLFASNVNSQLPENDIHSSKKENVHIDSTMPNIKEAKPETERSDDIIKLNGEDEIIVEVEKGIFTSLLVDGQKVRDGQMYDQLIKSFPSDNPNSKNKRDQRFYIKGNPMLEFKNSSYLLHGEDSHFDIGGFDKKELRADTLPKKIILDQKHVTVITEKNGKKIEVTKENDKITKLIIDGKTIPESEYGNYQNDIDAATEDFIFRSDNDFEFFDEEGANGFGGLKEYFYDFPKMDSTLSNSFGMMFDGENWREFGGNLEQLLDNDVFKKMEDMENFRMFDSKDLENFEGLKELEDLEKVLEKMGIQLDSSMRMYDLDMDGFEGFNNFKGFDGFEFFDDDNIHIRENEELFGSNTVVDKIGAALNRDGLLKEYKSNKIELSGKHLKINGEKMPKALFNKYKNIYQETTGAPLTKKSKMVFDVEGKPSKRKVRTF